MGSSSGLPAVWSDSGSHRGWDLAALPLQQGCVGPAPTPTLVIGFRAARQIRPRLDTFSLMTPAKTLSPNKVTFTVLGVRMWPFLSRGHLSAHSTCPQAACRR